MVIPMLIGYIRVSKNDGSQTLSPQRDAMLDAGVDSSRVYEDLASGRKDDRPGLTACLNLKKSVEQNSAHFWT
jgi:DNA invertase Pin-like site-specific DNA recombinase